MPISLSGSLLITGSLTTSGTLTAQTLVVQTVTSSIVYSSGSNIFGNSLTNTQQMTGSVNITGSLTVATTGTEFQVNPTGVKIGNVLTDNLSITGSMNVSGAFYITASSFQIISPSTAYGGAINLINTSNNKQWNITNVGSGTGTRNGNFEINNNAIDIFAISQSGNVGIGTSSPTALVQIQGAQAGVSGKNLTISYNGTYYAEYTEKSITAFNNELIIGTGTGGTEKMRITGGGYTKISNSGTYEYVNAAVHEIRQTAADYILYATNPNASPNGHYISYTTASPNGTSNPFLVCSDSTATRFTMRSNGGLANYQSNDANLSDERVKKDIISLESYWNKFKAIEIVKFKYKDQTHDDFNIGVIAQQVESVAPEFVDVDGWDIKPKLDKEGNEIITNEEPLKSIYTADLYHATIKVLQEAMTKIETLEARLTALENK